MQKIEQGLGLTASETQMNIRDPNAFQFDRSWFCQGAQAPLTKLMLMIAQDMEHSLQSYEIFMKYLLIEYNKLMNGKGL